jgi:type IV pilus assembly protein PilO
LTELWKKVTALTIRQQMIVVAMSVILLSYLFYIGLIAPQRERITELETQRDSDAVRLKLVDDFSQQHPHLEIYLAELDQKILQTDGLLPSDPAVGAFVIQIQQAAKDTQVEIFHIVPGTYLSNSGYYEIPIEVGVRGSFFKVVDFIQHCESLSRLTSIAMVNIQAKQGLLECKIPLVIYTFGTVPVKAEAGPNQPQVAVPQVIPAIPATK